MDIKGLEQRKEMEKVTQHGSTRVKICNSAIRSYLAKLHGFWDRAYHFFQMKKYNLNSIDIISLNTFNLGKVASSN